FVYEGIADYAQVVADLSHAEIENADFGAYRSDQFFDDMARVTQDRAHPDLVELLVTRSLQTMLWMRSKGVRFNPSYGRQAFKIDNKFKFSGGLAVEVTGGGPGLIDFLQAPLSASGSGCSTAPALCLYCSMANVSKVRAYGTAARL